MNRTTSLLHIFAVFSLCNMLLSCAQFVPPTGGEKDEEAPKVILSEPNNQTLNYKGQTFLLEFNELIDATKLRQELIVTPQPEGSYDIKAKPYSVLIKFDEPFKDSTTYTLNFRNGIKDLTEKNPAENLKFVFSTTDKIDSLKISGTVKDLWTGIRSEAATVALYNISEADTIPLLLRKPSYFITTDTLGVFEFENLKSSAYRILAFQDGNSNLIFDQNKESFAFLLDTIYLKKDTADLKLNLFHQDRSEMRRKRTLSRENNYSISYSKMIDTAYVEFLSKDSLTYKINGDELLFFNHPIPTDTVLTKILVLDSLGLSTLDTFKISFKEKISDREYKSQIIGFTVTPKRNDKIEPPYIYTLEFNEPIINLDTSKITITEDTLRQVPYTYTWLDSSHTKLEIQPNLNIQREALLNIESSAITSYKSDTNDTYTLINILYPQQDYGLISGAFEEDTTTKIVQLINAKSLQVSYYQFTTNSFLFPKVRSGNYYIRVIYDHNSNGQWDTSNFEENELQEDIYIYPQNLKLKSNFELRDIQLPGSG